MRRSPLPEMVSRRDAMKIVGATAIGIAGSSFADEPSGSPAPVHDRKAVGSKPMNESKLSFQRELPIRHEADVFVAGGGPAGVAAAVAAARQGARVFLAEGEACLGGMGTAGGLPLMCSFTDGVNFVAGGVGKMVHERMHAAGGVAIPSLRGNRDLYFSPEVLKCVYDDLLAEAGVEFTFNTHVLAVECEDGRLRHAVCCGKSGPFAVACKACVDATGDGDVCAWAGAPFDKGDEKGLMQPGSLISLWAGIDWKAAADAGCGVWKQSGRLDEAIDNGVFTVPDPGMPGITPTGKATGNGNLGHLFGVDGTDERSVTKAAIHGRKIAPEYGTYFREYLTGYENIELVTTAARVGIRETRRIRGDYVLTVDDYRKRAVFDDEIGRYAYAIDVHASTLKPRPKKRKRKGGGFDSNWLPDGESYGIPYRVLTPRGLHNVLASGRCVSADRKVLGSLRVMPGCFITGQAAGTAAAMVAEQDTDVRSLSVPQLQQRLIALGAYLPNAAAS